ncbi:hypothetical protein BCR32DRAFT_329066 [Anaeromyces robustus]|uniref:Ubiquitin-domain-containing protein n=1 Tax=Anaeromyces robustus TaxID=1754192 RepID=A0A1Y1WU63_9FUNG|nr:hypothetical protein BCR32DRAFT_329066 [Anaeromyces robustus]|eukprot:ORX77080.1 hypothetical protein BCR32DRAFT_329066 [Anaeromyces robustus]
MDERIPEPIEVNIIQRNEETISLSVDVVENTVLDLKNLLYELTDIKPEEQRLVYSGKILNDEDLLSFYNIRDGNSIYLVRAAKNKIQSISPQAISQQKQQKNKKAASGGMDSELVSQLLDNPFVQSVMSNPDFIRSIYMSNPQFKKVIEKNPEMAQIFNDPEYLKQCMEIARNPEMMNEMLRNQDRAMNNLESIPGGFQALSSLYQTVQSPLMDSLRPEQDKSTKEQNEYYAKKLLNGKKLDKTKINNDALPNPWNFNANESSSSTASPGLFNSMFSPFSAPPPVNETQEELEARYAEQLKNLNEMGFYDKKENLKALQTTRGNVEMAVNYLLQHSNKH